MSKLLIQAALLMTLTASVRAENGPTSAPGDNGFNFAPRSQITEKTRVDGRTRGDSPTVYICCSDYCELTTREQPTLFWYLGANTTGDFLIVIRPADDDHADPVLDVKVHGGRAGLQRLDLAEKHVSLQPGLQYEIVVDLVVDAHHREKDAVARARIERIKPPIELSELLSKRPGKLERADVYRRRQIWYDALAALSDEIADRETAKADTISLHRKRYELFRSCNLPDIAAAELKQANG